MRRTTRRLPLLAGAMATVAVGTAGCSLKNANKEAGVAPVITTTTPQVTTTTTKTPAAGPAGDPTLERGGTIPAAAKRANAGTSGGRTPRQLLQKYARLYGTWTTSTLIAHQHALASLSTGAARANVLQTIATYKHSPATYTGGLQSTVGNVHLNHKHARTWTVTIARRTAAPCRASTVPKLTQSVTATVQRTRKGWEVSSWTPQN